MIYLDHQASTPTHPQVVAAMQPYYAEFYANPHAGDHAAGWSAADAIETARSAVAEAINADEDEIIFTSGATEANNLAILGLTRADPKRTKIVVTAIEHKAVLAPARARARDGVDLIVAPVDLKGRVDLDRLSDLVDEKTLLVSAMLVNNEMGVVQPISEVSRICRAAGAYLHTDAAQALPWMPIDVLDLGVDFMSLSGHKASGPKGIGALFVSRDVKHHLEPLIHGGDQERGLRAGTLPTPLCVGLGEACRLLPEEGAVTVWKAVTATLMKGLTRLFPQMEIIGDADMRHPGNLCVRIPGIDAERLVALLQPDVALARGSACTSGIPEPSHVLRAMGLTAHEASEVVRLSTSASTTDEEIAGALRCFADVVDRLKLAA
ncbi:cysteine desulfurase family protein [Erythrobacter sp. HI0028]|uniref:cysteine desulfurase family protein n=3 Tax=unclassified Erythrobacter TaxID=2633097 RepID=UPI000A5A8880|nr:cysteine desulfurase family protein [Erythrobacter sp. HI0028]